MFGSGAKKNGQYIPYYVCSKRSRFHDCDQDYIRADRIESAVINDIKTIFRDRELIDKVWQKVNRKLLAEKPSVESEIARLETRQKDVQTRLDRYFEAFEQGTLKPKLCNEKVEALSERLSQLEAERADLKERQSQLELPAVDHKTIEGLVDKFERRLLGERALGGELLEKHVRAVHARDDVDVLVREAAAVAGFGLVINAAPEELGVGPAGRHLGIETPWPGLFACGDWVYLQNILKRSRRVNFS